MPVRRSSLHVSSTSASISCRPIPVKQRPDQYSSKINDIARVGRRLGKVTRLGKEETIEYKKDKSVARPPEEQSQILSQTWQEWPLPTQGIVAQLGLDTGLEDVIAAESHSDGRERTMDLQNVEACGNLSNCNGIVQSHDDDKVPNSDRASNNNDKQTQSFENLVKSALRRSKVDIKNLKSKHFQDENKNLNFVCPFEVDYEKVVESDANCIESGEFSCSPRKEECTPKSKPLEIKRIKLSDDHEDSSNDIQCHRSSSESDHLDWCDGNTFTCNKCMFKSACLSNFSMHVKCHHKTTLAKFSGCYNKTDVQYQCKCCTKQVYHEKSVVKEHVECHLLSLEKYASLYEARKSKNKAGSKENCCKTTAEPGQALAPNSSHPLSCQEEDKSPDSNQSHSKDTAAPSPPPTAVPAPPPVSSCQTTSSQGLESSVQSVADKFVYICPFPGCDFQTDMQGMKSGPAAEHGIAVHQVSPWEVKKHGLKWKRMSLEKRMRQIFAEA
eukprot:GFUD01025953.1.p1 GENE.GFUD01025953.1~~GFUD01025953.1.p1  ORF type:complete len:498 (+),score=139.47 GFUD01025953.1:51-1544(+)